MSEEIERELREKLLHDAPWEALEIHWKHQSVFRVKGADLLEVAVAVVADDKDKVLDWVNRDVLARVSASEAKVWAAQRRTFDAIIVQPWVLIAAPDAS